MLLITKYMAKLYDFFLKSLLELSNHYLIKTLLQYIQTLKVTALFDINSNCNVIKLHSKLISMNKFLHRSKLFIYFYSDFVS